MAIVEMSKLKLIGISYERAKEFKRAAPYGSG